MAGTSVVIDASIAIKSVTPNPLRMVCETLLGGFSGFEITVPSLFVYETTSVLSKIVHFKQLTPGEGRQLVEVIAELDVNLVVPDLALSQSAFEWTHKLGRAAAYDIYYLALAETLGCELWTADQRLVSAADVPWVRWAGDYG